MNHAYWFKPKMIGYGATPTSWEGWVVTAGAALMIWASVAAIASHRSSGAMLLTSFASLVVPTIALLAISVKKTKRRPGWKGRQLSFWKHH
jgi:hypothetical protein